MFAAAASEASPDLVTLVERVADVRVVTPPPEEELLERTALELLLERVALLLERTELELLLEERVAVLEEVLLERVLLADELLLERVAEPELEERVALLPEEDELFLVSWVDTALLLLEPELDLVLEDEETELEDLVEEPDEVERVVPLLFLVWASISGAVSMENPTNTEAAIVINFLIASWF